VNWCAVVFCLLLLYCLTNNQKCVLKLIEGGMNCPMCRSQLVLEGLCDAEPVSHVCVVLCYCCLFVYLCFSDFKSMHLALGALRVYCLNKMYGCQWIGPQSQVQSHMTGGECAFVGAAEAERQRAVNLAIAEAMREDRGMEGESTNKRCEF
jgi:hypothetical protein